ncbi:MAG: aminodeoxychorismate/anthranilate synthase component II, partial [Flavobacteriales bacterium]
NLVHYIESMIEDKVDVFRNNEIELDKVSNYDKIILSPGPGLPKEAGRMLDLIEKYAFEKSILGVCLGHQAIAESFGGSLSNLNTVYHGIDRRTKIIDKEDYLFRSLPQKFNTGHYHSWVVSNECIPKEFDITAVDDQNQIMAMSHKKLDVKGVQFHPESILTEHGIKIIENWVSR